MGEERGRGLDGELDADVNGLVAGEGGAVVVGEEAVEDVLGVLRHRGALRLRARQLRPLLAPEGGRAEEEGGEENAATHTHRLWRI